MYRLNHAAQHGLAALSINETATGMARRTYAGIAGLFRAIGRRRAVRHMARLDDRLLADIGLNRSDVASALAQPLWVDSSRALAELVDNRRRGRLLGRPLAGR